MGTIYDAHPGATWAAPIPAIIQMRRLLLDAVRERRGWRAIRSARAARARRSVQRRLSGRRRQMDRDAAQRRHRRQILTTPSAKAAQVVCYASRPSRPASQMRHVSPIEQPPVRLLAEGGEFEPQCFDRSELGPLKAGRDRPGCVADDLSSFALAFVSIWRRWASLSCVSVHLASSCQIHLRWTDLRALAARADRIAAIRDVVAHASSRSRRIWMIAVSALPRCSWVRLDGAHAPWTRSPAY